MFLCSITLSIYIGDTNWEIVWDYTIALSFICRVFYFSTLYVVLRQLNSNCFHQAGHFSMQTLSCQPYFVRTRVRTVANFWSVLSGSIPTSSSVPGFCWTEYVWRRSRPMGVVVAPV